MTASSVVEVQPGLKGCCSFGAGGEDLPVGPLDLDGAVESFDLAVLPGAGGLMVMCWAPISAMAWAKSRDRMEAGGSGHENRTLHY